MISATTENDADVLAITGASAALAISEIPFEKTVAGVRVGLVNGQFVINPTHDERENSDLDLIYVGNKTDVIMIEGAADELPEADFIAALHHAQTAVQKIIAAHQAEAGE